MAIQHNRTSWLCLSALIVVFAVADVAHATDPTNARLHQAFLTMLDDPANIEKTLDYAQVAIELEDYESAIPPLERILFFNPSLNDVKLKLAMMYFHLKSYDVAKHYLLEIKQSNDVGKDVLIKTDEYLRLVEEKK